VRSLFAKFLLWFWLGLAVILGVEIALESTSLEHGLALLPGKAAGPLSWYADLARETLEERGTAGLDSLLLRFDSRDHLQAWLVGRDGADPGGHPIPNGVRKAGASALRSGRSMLVETANGFFVGYPLGRRDQRETALVLHPTGGRHEDAASGSPERAGEWPPFIPFDLAVRAFATLVLGGLGCYLLARYITAPVIRLRQATRRIASGDLTARVGSERRKRRDEIEDLGRDFDRMAERLEQLVSAQRRLLTDISHELRSPLARMNVALGLLREGGAEDRERMTARLEVEAERLNQLIGDVLTLSRAESGEPVPAFESVDLGAMVEEVAADARFEARSRVREIRLAQSGPVVTSGAPGLLRSAIENVIRNAVRHTRPGTDVEIVVERRGNSGSPAAVIEVRDHGPGVPEDQLERIFEPFYRFGETRDAQASGTGLGLAIARRVLARHRGDIRAALAAGGGLAITIRLPLEEGD
jgi:two-component system sensor histidine kinase CpxA